MNICKSVLLVFIFVGLIFSFASVGSAQSADVNTTAQLFDQIQKLQAQILTLQAQLGQTKEELSTVKKELILLRSLSRGSSGDDVRNLQEFLASDEEIYPEKLATGYYGRLTEEAVKRFQKKYELEQAGVVGPKTKARIQELLAGDKKHLYKIPPQVVNKYKICDIATSTSTPSAQEDRCKEYKKIHKNDLERLKEEERKVSVCHIPPGNSAGKHTIVINKAALSAHLAHGDMPGACNGGTATTTSSDVTAPIISGIVTTNTTNSGVTIKWNTNELSNGKVWYRNISPVLIATSTLQVSHVNLALDHSLTLSGLSASTTYYYIVTSRDGVGNTATSGQNSFLTK